MMPLPQAATSWHREENKKDKRFGAPRGSGPARLHLHTHSMADSANTQLCKEGRRGSHPLGFPVALLLVPVQMLTAAKSPDCHTPHPATAHLGVSSSPIRSFSDGEPVTYSNNLGPLLSE